MEKIEANEVKSVDNALVNEENPITTVKDAVKEKMKGLSPNASKMLIEAYYRMPYMLRDAVEEFGRSVVKIDDMGDVEKVKRSLSEVKRLCGLNPEYSEIYEGAKLEAKDAIAEAVANGGLGILGDDEDEDEDA